MGFMPMCEQGLLTAHNQEVIAMFKKMLYGVAASAVLAAGMLAIPASAQADSFGFSYSTGQPFYTPAPRVWVYGYSGPRRYHRDWDDFHHFHDRDDFHRRHWDHDHHWGHDRHWHHDHGRHWGHDHRGHWHDRH